MIICAFCGQLIAIHRSAIDEVKRQMGAYQRHLSSHGVSAEQAKTIAEHASLHTVIPPSTENHQSRWFDARLMWAQGSTVAEIAMHYEVSEKAMRTRIQRWRNQHGWFPARA